MESQDSDPEPKSSEQEERSEPPRPQRSYDVRKTLTAVDVALKQHNKVEEAAEADRLFVAMRFEECAGKCYVVLRPPAPSEAIQARCHMYLATETVGPEEPSQRASVCPRSHLGMCRFADAFYRYHAAGAIHLWSAVIDRTGKSRFPIEKAKVQLGMSRRLFEQGKEECEEEHEVLPMATKELAEGKMVDESS